MEAAKRIIAVSAYVKNDKDKVLLVKTHYRSDTWELPGGQVEIGESLEQALIREVQEETGIKIQPMGITGVYYNETNEILTIVFKANHIGGEIKVQLEEIKEAKFVELTRENIEQYITRPHFLSRTIDAMKTAHCIPFESWRVSSYEREQARCPWIIR